MNRSKLAGMLWLCLSAAPLACWPADNPVAAANRAQGETIVVRAKLNTEDKGDIFVERAPDGDFLVKVQDLKAMGFKDPSGAVYLIEGEPHVSLRSMAGVSFDFQSTDLTLNITARPQLLPAQSIAIEGQRTGPAGFVPKDSSLFFNYALSSDHGGAVSSPLGFSGEAGWRSGNFLFLANGNTVADDVTGARKFVRLMSSVTHDDREALRRTVVGDFFTPTREFSTGINIGGISISKLYGLNPYFIQFPMQNLSGNVALPSDLEVYVDGQRVRSERLKPGEFELRDILAYGGARNVQVVLRDAFGRVQQLNYSFYFSDQPLRQGLQEYSYNLGAIRRNFGIDSNRYGPAAFSMFHRYGLTDAVTLGMRAEGTSRLMNGGPTATVVLGGAGVAGLALAGSSIAGRHGAAGLASYTYQSQHWGFGASLRRDWGDYAGLGENITVSNRKYEASLTASYQLGTRGTISATHSFFTTRGGFVTSSPTRDQPFGVTALSERRVTSLGYSLPLVSGWAALTTSLSHINDQPLGGRNEVFVGVTVFLNKDYSVAVSHRRDNTTNSQTMQLIKQQPIGEGFGFNMTADRGADTIGTDVRLRSTFQYNAPAAVFRADLGHEHDARGNVVDDSRISVAGGVGYVADTLAFGRPITSSFGIVKVGELPGVGISVNGQRIGETNAHGTVFVPTLSPYLDNDISIAAETVPIDFQLPALSRKISPSLRSGALIEFPATRLQAFTGKLKARETEGTKAVEFAEIKLPKVKAQPGGFQTGRGGEFYLENLLPGTYDGSVAFDGEPCLFKLAVPHSTETFVELGDVVCSPAP